MAKILAIIAVLLTSLSVSHASSVKPVELPTTLSEIIKTRGSLFVVTTNESYRVIPCGSSVCLRPSGVKGEANPAVNGLPDGKIAIHSKGDIRGAWYGKPTRRYDHGVLGDGVEGGALVVIDQHGKRLHVDLPDYQVFEDITPRLFDLTNDGRTEVITIRSSDNGGAAVVIYGLRNGKLTEIASSEEIGRRNRWLNISGIARYFGNDRAVITWVRTPHIGGILYMAVLTKNGLEQFRAPQPGFSNHEIGSRRLKLSATADFDRDGRLDLALPSADRQSLKFVTAKGTKAVSIRGTINRNMAAIAGGVLVGTESGRLYFVKP